MPGSKRRQLKKLLSPNSSTDPSPSASPAPIPRADTLSPPPANGSASGNGTGKSPSGISNFFHRKSPGPGATPASTGMGTGSSSIASNPNNYLSDEQLQEDLALEAMVEREGTIGAHPPPRDLSLPLPANSSGGAHVTASAGTTPAPAAPGVEGLDVGGGDTRMKSPSPSPSGSAPAPGSGGGFYAARTFGGSETKGKKKSSKEKFLLRQERKKAEMLNSAPPDDPAWNDQLEKERQKEIQVITGACNVLEREIHEIAPDGHCMFNAIADQLHAIGVISSKEATHTHLRGVAANYILTHRDDFLPFLPSVSGEDAAGATDDGIMSQADFERYCQGVAETGEWGGEPEIQALTKAYQIPIHVIQSGPPTIVSHGGSGDDFGGAMTPEQSARAGDKVVRISYHKRMYGLGEHYNSLRKVA